VAITDEAIDISQLLRGAQVSPQSLHLCVYFLCVRAYCVYALVCIYVLVCMYVCLYMHVFMYMTFCITPFKVFYK